MIFEIMIINADFRISENASHVVFLKNTKANKIKTNFFFFFFENRGHTFAENAMILTCARSQIKVLMFGEVGASENYFCG